MKLTSLALALALLPAALFAANDGAPTVIPGGSFASTYVISTPGAYVLGGNRSANTAIYVIQIAAPDVTLDLNGFRLSNAPGVNIWGGGIHIPTPENVEIRNGSIVNPGSNGIKAESGKGVRVIDVRVIDAAHTGMTIQADASLVDRCHITDSKEYGLYVIGGGTLVTDCVVNGSATSKGVTLSNCSRAVRTVARGCSTGFLLYYSASAVDCSATGGVTGFYMTEGTTLRGVESVKNSQGVYVYQTGCVIMGSRISNNTTNFTGGGAYINGGLNVIY